MIRRMALTFLTGTFLSPLAEAQIATAPAPAPAASGSPANSLRPQPPAANADSNAAAGPRTSLFDPIPTDPAHPAYHEGAHRSIVRHNPLPRRVSYAANSDRSAGSSGGQARQSGYSNGGVGRYREFYDSNTLAPQVDNHPVPVGRFDTNPDTNRAEQISAAQVGNQRAQTTQNTINAYGRPYGAIGAGFGYGLGLAGGGLYSFPN